MDLPKPDWCFIELTSRYGMSSIVEDKKSLRTIVFEKIEYSSFDSLVWLLAWNRICLDLIVVKVCKNLLQGVQLCYHSQIIVFPSQSKNMNLGIPDIVSS